MMNPNERDFVEKWVTRADLDKFKKELIDEISRLLTQEMKPEQRKWLKSYEVRKLLNVSAGTLQTLRINGTLPFTKIGGALYYELNDIERLLDKNKKLRNPNK